MKAKIIEKNLIDSISGTALNKILEIIQEDQKIKVGAVIKKYGFLFPSKEPFMMKDIIELRKA